MKNEPRPQSLAPVRRDGPRRRLAIALFGIAALGLSCGEKVDLDEDQPEIEKPSSEKQIHKDLLDYPDGHEATPLAQDPPGKVGEIEGLTVKTEVTADDDARALRYGEIAKLHIIGRLADGREFKNTWTTEPEVVRIYEGALPRGLAIALDGIKIGERRSVRVPPSAAYGKSGDPMQQIPKNAILFYTVSAEEVVEGFEIHQMKAAPEADAEELHIGDSAKFHYTGILAKNGKEFDSSRGKGEPFQTVLQGQSKGGQLIDGWALGLQGLKVGEQRRVFIPSEYAYGERGSPPNIGADADLIFEVELVEVTKPDAAGD